MPELSPERFAQLAPAIQERILKAKAAAERREQKKENRLVLKGQLRYEELRAIPLKQRTEEEQKEFRRLYQRQHYKKNVSEKKTDVLSTIKSETEFWKLNRASLGPDDRTMYSEREETVLDTLAWMDRVEAGLETPEHCGENYVSLEEGVADILADVKEFGVAHLGYILKHRNIPPDWTTGAFTKRAFFRDAEVFNWLCDESRATKIYVKYGYLTGLPDWRVSQFLQSQAGWSFKEATEAVGQVVKDRSVFYPGGEDND